VDEFTPLSEPSQEWFSAGRRLRAEPTRKLALRHHVDDVSVDTWRWRAAATGIGGRSPWRVPVTDSQSGLLDIPQNREGMHYEG